MEQNRALTNELMSLEKKYWRAMQEHDIDTALALTDFPCLVAGPEGVRSVDRKEFIRMFEQTKDSSMNVIFTDEPKVRLLNENTVVIAYQIHSDMKHQGKNQSMDAVDTSTWIRRGDKWVCALHTETPITEKQ